MKKAILLFILSYNLHLSLYSQWQWAHTGTSTGSGWVAGYDVTTDAFGNTYVTGSFSTPTYTLGAFTLQNSGTATDDIFIAKYSPSGVLLWARKVGGIKDDFGRAITTDASGNVYASGHFTSDTLIFGNDTLFNTGVADVYLVKYDALGNVQWARSGGGLGFDESNSMCTDASGNVYIAGQFYSPSVLFGTFSLSNTNADTLDVFIAKYSPSGTVLWAACAGGNSNDAATAICTDATGNVIITGSSGSPSAYFGSVVLTNPGIFGYDDVFVVKYDSLGNSLWGSTGAGSIFEMGTGISADTAGNILVTGNFSSPYIAFDNDTLYNARYTGGPTDIFIVKYNSSGGVVWAKSAGTRYIDEASDVVTDISGNAYITGSFKDTTITFGSTALPNLGTSDIYIAKYDAAGNAVRAEAAGGTNTDDSYAMTINPFNNDIYITGSFRSSIATFGVSTVPTSGAYTDMFIAKYSFTYAGINDISNDDTSFIIYPNPTTGIVYLSTNDQQLSAIKVYNVLGEIVYQSTTKQYSNVTIDLSGQPKGVYEVYIMETNGNSIQKKLIIQ